MPNRRRTSRGFAAGSRPSMAMVPLVGRSRVVSIWMVVVLPAPLGPRKAKISPERTSNEIPPTAVTVPKVLTRFSTRIIGTSRLSIRDGAESARVRDPSPASLAEFAADVLDHRPGLLDRLPQSGRGHPELFAPVVHLPPLVHVDPRP